MCTMIALLHLFVVIDILKSATIFFWLEFCPNSWDFCDVDLLVMNFFGFFLMCQELSLVLSVFYLPSLYFRKDRPSFLRLPEHKEWSYNNSCYVSVHRFYHLCYFWVTLK